MPKSDRIREIAPGMSSQERAVIDEALSFVDGEVTIKTCDGHKLGSVNFGGSSSASIVVEFADISPGSGGELYQAASVHTPTADHYILNGLPTDIV